MMNEKYSLSVVIPTLGRKSELEVLLNTLCRSKIQPMEVIIVDQNPPCFLADVLQQNWFQLNIRHYNVTFKGASKARNFGISKVCGDVVCFPDDDCEIFPDTFMVALEMIKQYPVVFGKCVDREGKDSVIKFCSKDGLLTKSKMEGKFVEATMFVKTELIRNYPFDEKLGVGTFHGAEEAYDLILRLLADNIKIFFSNQIRFYHPNKVVNYSKEDEVRRVFTYRCGFAALCVKHRLYKKYFRRLMLILLYLPFCLLFYNGRVRYYLSELLGLITGVVVK